MKEVKRSVSSWGGWCTVGIAEKEIVYKFYPDIHPFAVTPVHTVFKNTGEGVKGQPCFIVDLIGMLIPYYWMDKR
jgi:hypothetical protein